MEETRTQSLLAEGPAFPAMNDDPELPECPIRRNDCLFVNGESTRTTMHSPLVYNRRGEPVGGGANVSTRVLHCTLCHRSWTAKQTELESTLGFPLKWDTFRR